jgi:two-component system nitrate/nitrite response regulator NarL
MIDTNADALAETHDAAPLRLLVITETRFVGEALAHALSGDPSIAAVAYANGVQAATSTSVARADAILVDAGQPDGAAIVRRLREMAPLRPIIACAVRESDDDILQWAEAGVTGYLSNTVELTQLAGLVSDILAGEQVCSGRAAAALFRRVADMDRATPVSRPTTTCRLTRRELQVAELVAAGFSDKQVAREFDISLYTTKTHVHNLLGKLNVGSRAEVGQALSAAGLCVAVRASLRPGTRDAIGKLAAD